MFEVKSIDETFHIIDQAFSNYYLEDEFLDIRQAVGRIASSDIFSKEDIPGFDRSTVDGYAVVSSDTFGCSGTYPAQLELSPEILMGDEAVRFISTGKAAYVPTGGRIPEGSDSVVMIEYCEDPGDGYIYIEKPSAPGSNIIFKGDDIRKDAQAVKAGTVLRPQEAGVLAAIGITGVNVKRKLRLGIISTGDELVEAGKIPGAAQIRDVNSYSIYAEATNYGIGARFFGIVRDNFKELLETTKIALQECDIIAISGGSSVGNRDETPEVITALGEPGVLIHGISIKPGKPTIIGKAGKKPVIGLPGHPVSAMIVFKIIVRYLIDTMNGIKRKYNPSLNAYMSENYSSNNGRTEYLPVSLVNTDKGFLAQPVPGKSGLIATLSRADGYVEIKRGCEGLLKGQNVDVMII